MAAKSFMEILEEQIRADLRSEIEAEVRASLAKSTEPELARPARAFGATETWLAANVAKSFFAQRGVGRKAYPPPPPRVREQTQERARTERNRKSSAGPRRSAKSVEELCALELLNRHSGLSLPLEFDSSQLKGAWRKAALKTHPDRFAETDAVTTAQMNVLFTEITRAFELLESLFGEEVSA